MRLVACANAMCSTYLIWNEGRGAGMGKRKPASLDRHSPTVPRQRSLFRNDMYQGYEVRLKVWPRFGSR
jgi:hypothetical protein